LKEAVHRSWRGRTEVMSLPSSHGIATELLFTPLRRALLTTVHVLPSQHSHTGEDDFTDLSAPDDVFWCRQAPRLSLVSLKGNSAW